MENVGEKLFLVENMGVKDRLPLPVRGVRVPIKGIALRNHRPAGRAPGAFQRLPFFLFLLIFF